MPILSPTFFSTYYIIELNFQSFFEILGIPYDAPQGTVRILASKYQVENSNDAKQELLIQGKTGYMVQNISAPIYTYTIEAPLIINSFLNGQTSFLPYNSLNFFAIPYANWQWQQINTIQTNSLNDTIVYIAIKEYSIDVNSNGIMQKLVLESNVLLTMTSESGPDNIANVGIDGFYITDLNVYDYLDLNNLRGRLLKNYDVFADILIQINNQMPYSLQIAPSGLMNVYLESTNFKLKFDIEKKEFLNSLNEVYLLFKTYAFEHKYTVVGKELGTSAPDYYLGSYDEYLTLNSISLFGEVLLQYQAPMVIQSKTIIYNADDLIKTDFNFVFNGTNYNPINSPFNGNLFYADIQ